MSALLAVILIFTILPFKAFAIDARYSDVSGHWASNMISKWSAAGVISGYNGKFRPNDPISRGEFASVIDRVMGYRARSATVFNDVSSNDWYAECISHLNAAGVMSGVGGGNVNPKGNINREQATLMLARAFSVSENREVHNSFSDEGSISSWAKAHVNGMKVEGYIHGKPGNIFDPKGNLTRAETVAMLDNIISNYYYSSGTYTTATEGNTLIRADGVTLSGEVSGNLYVASGVGDGNAVLSGITVTGTTFITGGRRVIFSGSFNKIVVGSGANVEEIELTPVATVSEVEVNAPIELAGSGKIGKIMVYTDYARIGADVEVADGNIVADNDVTFNIGNEFYIGLGEEITLVTETILKEALDRVLESKSFGEHANNNLRQTFWDIYSNYQFFEQLHGISGFPLRNEYIFKNYIHLIRNNLDVVQFFTREQWIAFLNERNISGYMIEGLYVKEERAFYADDIDSSPLILHEVFHSSQQNIIYNYDDMLVYYAFVEGAAAARSAAANPDIYNGSDLYLKDPIKSRYALSHPSYGYYFLGNFFEKIELLVGYNAVERYKIDGNLSRIKAIIDNKLGAGTGARLFADMLAVYRSINNESQPAQEAFLSDIRVETTVLDYFLLQAKSVTNQLQAKKLLNVYHHYRNCLMTAYVSDESGNGATRIFDHTAEIPEIHSRIQQIDETLASKLIGLNALPIFFSDPALNLSAVKALMHSDRSTEFYYENIPINLYQSSYYARIEAGTAKFSIMKNGNGYKTSFTFLLDESGILSVESEFLGMPNNTAQYKPIM